jgi:hypothetical protein
MTVARRYELSFVGMVYVWTLSLILGMASCMDDPDPTPFPREETCEAYLGNMRSVDDVVVVPSLTPANFGVRIIVAPDFNPLEGSSYPVPGGRLVWNVWIYHWTDGDHMGAVGRIEDTDMCRWYGPR